jgi:hypothetical protein
METHPALERQETGLLIMPTDLFGPLAALKVRSEMPLLPAMCVMVGDTGLEPVTSCMSSKHSNQLS